jgi:hypothetical protein
MRLGARPLLYSALPAFWRDIWPILAHSAAHAAASAHNHLKLVFLMIVSGQ